MQPVLDAELARHRDYAPLLRGVDLEPILEAASRLLAEEPLTGPLCAPRSRTGSRPATPPRSRTRAAAGWPSSRFRHAGSGGARRRCARRPWRPGSAARSLRSRRSTKMVLRYLAAFGPAKRRRRDHRVPADRDARGRGGSGRASRRSATRDGRELFDLPGAPRPDADVPRAAAVPARVRQRAALACRPRRRFVPEGLAGLQRAAGLGHGTLLQDGLAARRLAPRSGPCHRRRGARGVPRRAPAEARDGGDRSRGRRYLRFAAADAGPRDVRVDLAYETGRDEWRGVGGGGCLGEGGGAGGGFGVELPPSGQSRSPIRGSARRGRRGGRKGGGGPLYG